MLQGMNTNQSTNTTSCKGIINNMKTNIEEYDEKINYVFKTNQDNATARRIIQL